MLNWRKKFVKCLEGLTSANSQLEKALDMKAEHMPKRIYRYQSDVDYRRKSLATDKIWLSSPDKWNDPYDCEFVISDASVEAEAHQRLEKEIAECEPRTASHWQIQGIAIGGRKTFGD